MKVELKRDDIIKEFEGKNKNEGDFFFDIIENSSTSFESLKYLINKLIEHLEINGELSDDKKSIK